MENIVAWGLRLGGATSSFLNHFWAAKKTHVEVVFVSALQVSKEGFIPVERQFQVVEQHPTQVNITMIRTTVRGQGRPQPTFNPFLSTLAPTLSYQNLPSAPVHNSGSLGQQSGAGVQSNYPNADFGGGYGIVPNSGQQIGLSVSKPVSFPGAQSGGFQFPGVNPRQGSTATVKQTTTTSKSTLSNGQSSAGAKGAIKFPVREEREVVSLY